MVELQKDKAHFAPDSVIIITTPPVVNEESAPALPATNTLQEPSDAQLVLLVEDNTELSSFLANQLRTQYRVEIAADGLQGLHKAQQQMPDLIVSDIMMPNMDGITMLDQLKRDPVTSHIPVVLLSARYDVQSQIEGLQYGADYYITKPFHTEFLKASINNLLRQRTKVFRNMQNKEKPKAAVLNPSDVVITTQDEQFLDAVISFVEESMHEPEFEIEAMATSANMSRSAFYKKFKSLTNMAPLEFVNEMRLKRAKQLFDAGEQNVSSVNYSTGFNSAKYFSTCFKKYFECPPSDYIKNRTTIGEQTPNKK
ncbi:response regulator [Niastella sp. OAS944]|uniref:response regulator transcription factor n=1 Tax=Niastella sp. OAS944 TaxID=2664089 RepID=UPI00347928A5|nr:DNA-binding response OmpR family regulator [Chitinophagaceae bacterium OAS944]